MGIYCIILYCIVLQLNKGGDVGREETLAVAFTATCGAVLTVSKQSIYIIKFEKKNRCIFASPFSSILFQRTVSTNFLFFLLPIYWITQVHIHRDRMSHCHDEHDHHGHGHDHGEHDHSDDITPALQSSLYEQINFDEITTLNESRRDAGKAIVKKTWAERLSQDPELESDADEQLLMTVP